MFLVVKSIQAKDGLRRVDIVHTGEGTFRYYEQRKCFAGEDDEGVFPEWWWAEAGMSGLYPDADLAEAGARSDLAWLKEKVDD